MTDYQGSVRASVRADGSREEAASAWARNAFGALEGASGTGGTTNPQAGYTGASTPNVTGGFTYLRNRWYDASTGRFLTQDPIGLAGGVNLYEYAGSNPIAFDDPFGLCVPPATPACVAAIAAAPAVIRAAPQIVSRGSALVRNLANSGVVRRIGEAAHHIVARTAARAAPARQALDRVGVGLDEAVNGVVLPAVRGAAGPAANHLAVHTNKYYDAVNGALANVATREQAIQVLDGLKQALLNGTMIK